MEQVFLETILLIVHQNDLITDPAKLDCITYPELETFSLIEIVIGIERHVLHAEPELISWVCFFFFGGFYLVLVVYPVIVVFEEDRRTAWNEVVWHRHHL
jgi:hypothetical protein